MKRIGLTLVVAASMIFTTVSCHKSQPPEPGLFRISGTITDSLTGSPVDSVRIVNETTGSDEEYYSNESGFYQVVAREGSKPLVRAFKNGYRTKRRELPSIRMNVTSIDFELVPDSLSED